MASFDVHEWHQTTEEDLQHIAVGGGDYEYAVWEAELSFGLHFVSERERRHNHIANAAHKLAEQRGLIPYSSETFSALMDEVECVTARTTSQETDHG